MSKIYHEFISRIGVTKLLNGWVIEYRLYPSTVVVDKK